jgi:hypothetical protein
MYSVKQDRVLDPFLGTGTTLLAAMAAGRNSTGIEIDANFEEIINAQISGIVDFANDTIHERLRRHEAFVMERRKADKPLKHVNGHYGFPVIMNQEKNLKFNPLTRVDNPEAGVWTVDYSETVDWQSTIENSVSIEPAAAPAPERKIRKRQHKNAPADQVPANSQSDNKTDNPPDEKSDARNAKYQQLELKL